MKITLQQAAGNLPRKEFESIYNSLANPAASCGECARYQEPLMRIRVNHQKCTGCHLCELVCSLFHLGIINPEKSAIRIQKDDLNTSMNTPVVCRQCKEMRCLDGEGGTEASAKPQFLWAKERAARCPFNSLNVLGQDAYHCDLCGGNPQCVLVCTSKAIHVKK